jgi:hypothetical protein
MSSIRLHPKHGVNPTMGVCAWCGQPDGSVALLGAAYHGEAPRYMVVSDEPCDSCKSHMAKGITFIEARESTVGRGPQRTGRWCVLTEDAVRRLVREPLLAHVLKHRKALLEPETWERMGLPTTDIPPAPAH